MIGELTSRGWELHFTSRGAGRFLAAAFLGFWLCGWAVGEGFAVWLVFHGARSALAGVPPTQGGEPLPLAAALGMGMFILFWLCMWTVGGILAMQELLRLLWSEDRFTVDGGGLTVEHVVGPFRSTHHFSREEIREVMLVPRGGRLVVRTDQGTVHLSQLGTRAEREQAAAALHSRLGVSQTTGARITLPREWEEIITPEGERAVTSALGTRRVQSRITLIATLALASITFIVVGKAMTQLALVPLAVLLLAATAGTAWGALWLARGRLEWRIGSGRLTLRRRFGAGVRDVFEARGLEISVTSDSDGDDWYQLEAVDSAASNPRLTSHPWPLKRDPSRRRLASVMNDAAMPRQLGAWLARAAGVELHDAATQKHSATLLARVTAESAPPAAIPDDHHS